ncbi:MAG: YicC/YloC family endoribonuclease [Alphaproteobacteria bacterium]
MTGFARAEGSDESASWAWELRCVNGRSLDMRCRMPADHNRLDRGVRKALSDRFKRGNLSANLTLNRGDGRRHYQINQALLAKIGELAQEMDVPLPGLEDLVNVRGLFEPLEEEDTGSADRDGAILKTLAEAIIGLDVVRREEGARLAVVLSAQIDEMARLTAQAAASASVGPEALQARLARMMGELLAAEAALPEERLAQELALLVGKADVREELDRLGAHIEAARDLLKADGPVGRRLEFLCQELNREVNTICSKAADIALTRIGLDLKAVVDQLREQVQNIE